MRYIKSYAAWIAAVALVVAGCAILGPTPAWAASGGGKTPAQEGTTIGVPFFAIGAIVVIGAVAIWQGYKDSEKKKEAQKQKERDLEEQNEFDKYFEEESGDTDAAGSGGETSAADAPTETPAGDTTAVPATAPTGP